MKYATNGFNVAKALGCNDMEAKLAAAVAITKGQVLFDNGAGYATNVGTAFANTFLGVAAADCDNSAGDAGALSVTVIRPLPHISFWVKNESATVATQTDVGTIIDLESNDGVDVTDNTIAANAGYGFRVQDIDISATALTANAGGFIKGFFEPNPTS